MVPVVDEDPLAPSKQNAAITISSVSRRAGVTRKSIYRKLEVHTRGEAVFEAVQQGLIRL